MADVTAPIAKSSPPPGAPRTVAEALGQIVWLLTQSPLHRELRLKMLEPTFMPAIVHEQFRVFRFGPLPGADPAEMAKLAQAGMTQDGIEQMPLGVAIWANVSEAVEGKIERGEPLEMADWKSGDRTWLLELITPFATEANKLSHAMMLDLMNGPFKGRPFFLHRTDPATGTRNKVLVDVHLQTQAG